MFTAGEWVMVTVALVGDLSLGSGVLDVGSRLRISAWKDEMVYILRCSGTRSRELREWVMVTVALVGGSGFSV